MRFFVWVYILHVIAYTCPMILPTHPGKAPTVVHQDIEYTRHMVRTNRVDADTDLVGELVEVCGNFLQDNDTVCIAESVVAITQKRAYKIADIVPGFTARTLARFVTKTPAGIGLGMPETMQLAVNEVGICRLWFAAAVAAITRTLGRPGDFYRLAGERARGIDGPTSGTLPPYNEYATLIPNNPRKVAQDIEAQIGKQVGKTVEVVLVDANDIGVNILGARDKAQKQLATALSLDNPMGQGHEQTPVMIARKIS